VPSRDQRLSGNGSCGWLAAAVGFVASAAAGYIASTVRCRKADPTFPRVTAHDLRHTAASLAISAGANPKVVQRMLGHAGAAVTLDVYADLFESDLDAVAGERYRGCAVLACGCLAPGVSGHRN
jgi:hypothetical protein